VVAHPPPCSRCFAPWLGVVGGVAAPGRRPPCRLGVRSGLARGAVVWGRGACGAERRLRGGASRRPLAAAAPRPHGVGCGRSRDPPCLARRNGAGSAPRIPRGPAAARRGAVAAVAAPTRAAVIAVANGDRPRFTVLFGAK